MLKLTHSCGSLRGSDAGKKVSLAGWVSSWRDHGGVVFIDIRDISGITQIVFGRDESADNEELLERAHLLRGEYVIAVSGEVILRPEGTRNEKIPTGEIEVAVSSMELLNTCRELPFDMKNMDAVSDEVRLKYRYLEMRAGRLKDNIIFKHKLFQTTRNFFSDNGFLEIETPFLTKSTPEGARDFLVPSRLNPGNFYALPQSPQLFKQLLMIGGFMRYFQIVRCFRDEDLRQDRQPEFTQLDLEMSFIDEEDIKNILQDYVSLLFKELLDIELKTPFPEMTYADAMLRFGSDKPDLRNPIEIKDITDIAARTDFKVFKQAAEKGVVRGIKLSDAEEISLSTIAALTKEVAPLGAKGLAWIRHREEGLHSQITKFFSQEILSEISERFDTVPGDILFFIADTEEVACKSLSYLRDRLFTPDENEFRLLWIVDYPLFEKDSDTGAWIPIHHPFTAPNPEDVELLNTDPGSVRSRAYDLVLNGSEIGGGSIRIHSMELQKKIFNLLNISDEEADAKFGFLLKGLEFGAPPHGGFAFGVDRLATKMLGLSSIRDLIPFPKTQRAYSPLSGAPSTVEFEQLTELGLKLDVPTKKKED
ncbi:MAG: aspartate--tRNA ligase [Elusimicrobia bacterium]|nr:aspartate--tRNA ligase [Elusimicrobiota bacterium]